MKSNIGFSNPWGKISDYLLRNYSELIDITDSVIKEAMLASDYTDEEIQHLLATDGFNEDVAFTYNRIYSENKGAK
jgi:hypothetical protein